MSIRLSINIVYTNSYTLRYIVIDWVLTNVYTVSYIVYIQTTTPHH